MKPKTIRDFLLTIEDEKIRTEAIENFENDKDYKEYKNAVAEFLCEALSIAFWWDKTPPSQGYEYWRDIHSQAQNNTLKTREIE